MRDPWMSASEVADELRVSAGRVRQLLAAGQLPGSKLGRAWLIRRADLERYGALPPGTKGLPVFGHGHGA